MNPLIIIASLLVLVSLFGVIRRNRQIFLTGYFVYGILVFGAELNNYAATQEATNLLVAFLWLVQAVLAIPTKLPYDGSKLAKSAAVKINASLSIINWIGVLIPGISPAPEVTFYLHLILAIFPLIAIALVLTNKIAITADR